MDSIGHSTLLPLITTYQAITIFAFTIFAFTIFAITIFATGLPPSSYLYCVDKKKTDAKATAVSDSLCLTCFITVKLYFSLLVIG